MTRPDRAPLLKRLKRGYRRRLVDAFHRYYYTSGAWTHSTWLGVPTLQAPGDMVALAQILFDTQPDIVVETGTHHGGSALFFATVLSELGHGEVLTVDLDHSKVHERVRGHERVVLLEGNSTEPTMHAAVRAHVRGRRAMLFLDAGHTKADVLAELRGLADLVAPGCYAVVADTNLSGHPLPELSWAFVGEGPYEAVELFLTERNDFARDLSREYQLLTFSPGGFLRRH